MVQLIDFKLAKPDYFDAFQLRFPAKVDLCKGMDWINEDMANFLLDMNSTRNCLAHRLGFKFTFDDGFAFVQSAARARADFSDDTIPTDKKNAEEWYRVDAIIQEVFQNTAQELAFVIEENGGQFEFS